MLRLLLIAAVLLTSSPASSQPLSVSTLAGSTTGGGYVDDSGSAARFSSPQGVVFDPSGNLYVADMRNYVIRRITPDGRVTTLAGKGRVRGAVDGSGDAARFDTPMGITIDTNHNLYVVDWGNHAIRRITLDGVVTTYAGSLGHSGTADGPGSTARFNYPSSLTADAAGNLYVADAGNDVIRRIDGSGNVTTFAGTMRTSGSRDGAGPQALFNDPTGIAVGAGGFLYVTDLSNHTVRKVDVSGAVSTLAGSAGQSGEVDGTGAAARFNSPWGIVADAAGDVFVTDSANHCVRKITPSGVVTTVAGHLGSWGRVDETGTAAGLNLPKGIAIDANGRFAVSDSRNEAIRLISPTFVVSTLAGSKPSWGATDAVGTAARFYIPHSPAMDAAGAVFVTDSNSTIRRIAPDGTVTTIAGKAAAPGSADGQGASARFNVPQGLTLDGSGNIYVADSSNHAIRKISPGGLVSTIAGTAGASGNQDATGAQARFNAPRAIAIDSSGALYVADTSNHAIRRIGVDGAVTTIAGSGTAGSNDGIGTQASFRGPWGIAVDLQRNVYVADTDNHTIRKITPAGVVTTIAGTAGKAGSTDGQGAAARFDTPTGLAVRADGTIFVADYANHTIRRVTPTGAVTTIAGDADAHGNVNGSGDDARFFFPNSIAIDSSGRLLIAESYNHAVRVAVFDPPLIQFSATPATIKAGETATLAWNVTAANTVSIDQGIGSVLTSGSRAVTPATNTLYTLTATGDGGTRSASTTVAIETTGARRRSVTPPTVPQSVSVTTLAGSTGGGGYLDGPAATAKFSDPLGLVFDSAGNLYVADNGNAVIRRISPAGLVTTIAGKAGDHGGVDGTGRDARFMYLDGMTVDTAGNVYVADEAAIRRITPAGAVTTYAGAPLTPGSADGPAKSARFNFVEGVAFDAAMNLYVADCGNHNIRKIDGAGNVTTLAGNASTEGSSDGTGAQALFGCPDGVVASSAGVLYVTDYSNNTVRRIDTAGTVSTLAGSAGEAGRVDGIGASARFDGPWGVVLDRLGNLVVADTENNLIRSVTPAGGVTTLAGTGRGFLNGSAGSARFEWPIGLAIDPNGRIAIGDNGNNVIRLLDASGNVSTLAGSLAESGSTDAIGTSARFNLPAGVAVDAAGNTYVSDLENQTIRKITGSGIVTTLAGVPGAAGSTDGQGAGARFQYPIGLAVDANGNVFVADSLNFTIRKIAPNGVVTTIAGVAGVDGNQDGAANQARFSFPGDVALDTLGFLYVADSGNHSIRRIAPDGTVTTLAGSGTAGSSDGVGRAASFNAPSGIAVDARRNIFVADSGNHLIRKITQAGVVTTIAGSAGRFGWTNGTGSAALFGQPIDVAVRNDGVLFVADFENNMIRRISPAGTVTTVAGAARMRGNMDGEGLSARFNRPGSLAIDSLGRVIVADTLNHAIRVLTFE